MTALWSLLGVVAELALAGIAAAPPRATTTADRDCSDLDNQAQAQRYFIQRGGPRPDPDRLDAHGDRIACVIYPR